MTWSVCLGGDLQSTLERRGLSIRYVVDSSASSLIMAEDIEDAVDGFDPARILTAANDNRNQPGRRLMAV